MNLLQFWYKNKNWININKFFNQIYHKNLANFIKIFIKFKPQTHCPHLYVNWKLQTSISRIKLLLAICSNKLKKPLQMNQNCVWSKPNDNQKQFSRNFAGLFLIFEQFWKIAFKIVLLSLIQNSILCGLDTELFN